MIGNIDAGKIIQACIYVLIINFKISRLTIPVLGGEVGKGWGWFEGGGGLL